MKRVGKKTFLIFWGFLLLTPPAFPVLAITVSGSWSFTISASNLLGAAGSDLTSTYDSATNVATIGVSGATSTSDTWRIDVYKTDSVWATALHLYIKRTNSGTSGTGAVTGGGTTFQEITAAQSQFFTGRGNRSGITCQEEIQGVSASLDAKSYSTTIRITVVDT